VLQRILAFFLLMSVLGFTTEIAAGEGEGNTKSVRIEDVPHVRQKPDFCGEACVAMWLAKRGHAVDQDAVFDLAGVDPVEGRGCRTPELARALERLGIQAGTIWHKIPAAEAEARIAALWQDLLADLHRAVPSIVCMRTSTDAAKATEHFRLVLGYDARTDEILYHEPAEEDARYVRLGRVRFLDLWPLKYKPEEWTVIRLRLAGTNLRLPPAATGFTAADYCQQVRRIRRLMPAEGFTLILQKPFLVVGDEAPAAVARRAEHTVRWATDHFKALYFEKDPPAIYTIWLFRDKASYEKHTRLIFGDRPSTPFGYCSSVHRALVMNIGTGGGTLVHEMVHAFVAGNFPACPAWFNEGLASLYEQCGEHEGRIVGFTNWRLAGLQKAIRAQETSTFSALCTTTSHQFYNLDRGSNYAQARYLCYYLQEKGLLTAYYRAFQAAAQDDPSGYETLKRVLHEEDMAAFQKRWEEWVLTLRFRE